MARVGPTLIALTLALTACPKPARRALLPAEMRHVVVTFESGNTVGSMMVGGDTVVPPACVPPPHGPLKALCTPAFQHLAHERGVRKPRLIDTQTTDAGTDYLFAAVIDGSGECGAYGFWLMRVDKTIHITEPIVGCFAFTYGDSGALEAGVKNPGVEWGPPFRLVVQGEAGGQRHTYTLDETAFALVSR
jgi:hypothetical protein